jgi:hypothetical protein
MVHKLDFWKFIGGLILILLCLVVIKIVFFPASTALNIIDQAGKVVSKTADADNVIYNYEWFKNTYNSVLATDQKIINLENEITSFTGLVGDRKNWTFEDKNEYARLSSTLTGLKNHRANIVADYNAKSSMINRKIFKGGDLPTNLY